MVHRGGTIVPLSLLTIHHGSMSHYSMPALPSTGSDVTATKLVLSLVWRAVCAYNDHSSNKPHVRRSTNCLD